MSSSGGRLLAQWVRCHLEHLHPMLDCLGLHPSSTQFQPSSHVHSGKLQVMTQVLGSLPVTKQRPGMSSQLLALAWPGPSCCGHLGNKPVVGSSLCPCLSPLLCLCLSNKISKNVLIKRVIVFLFSHWYNTYCSLTYNYCNF